MEYALEPKLLKGKITEVTEMCVKVSLKGRMGVITVPLRSVITDKPMETDQEIEVYLSYVRVL